MHIHDRLSSSRIIFNRISDYIWWQQFIVLVLRHKQDVRFLASRTLRIVCTSLRSILSPAAVRIPQQCFSKKAARIGNDRRTKAIFPFSGGNVVSVQTSNFFRIHSTFNEFMRIRGRDSKIVLLLFSAARIIRIVLSRFPITSNSVKGIIEMRGVTIFL